MLNEIKEKYQTFSDSVIHRIGFKTLNEETSLIQNDMIIFIEALNWKNDTWERLKIIFTEVTQIRIIENKRRHIDVVFEALICEDSGEVVFDFDPIDIDGVGNLKENPDSNFSVRCKSVSFELIA